jgi:hypothetical protein
MHGITSSGTTTYISRVNRTRKEGFSEESERRSLGLKGHKRLFLVIFPHGPEKGQQDQEGKVESVQD